MKLNTDLAGTGKVFRFTFLQLLKSRSNKITMILTLVVAMAAIPVMSLLKKDDAQAPVDRVQLENRTSLSLEGAEAWCRSQKGYEDFRLELGKTADAPEVLGVLLEQDTAGVYTLSLQNLPDGISVEKARSVIYLLDICISREKGKAAGLTDAQLALLDKEAYVSHYSYEDYLTREDEEDEEFDEDGYNVQLGYSILVMMICIYSVSYIIRSVIEEKSSKLVDLLMVSVKPIDLLLGKVLAVLVFVLLYMALMLGGAFLSYQICGLFMDVSAGSLSALSGLLQMELSPAGILVIVVSSVLGCVAFGLLAGLCGAGCSQMEDSGGAMGTCMLLIMLGYFVSMFAGMGIGGNGSVTAVLSVLPVLSMFMAPLGFMRGELSFGMVGLSWILELAFLLLILVLAAKVYSDLIIYNGKRLSLKQILQMAKGKEARA